MPSPDRELRLAQKRRWYAHNREHHIAKVARRKRAEYAGVCVVCGGPTIGQTLAHAYEHCWKHNPTRSPELQAWHEARWATPEPHRPPWVLPPELAGFLD